MGLSVGGERDPTWIDDELSQFLAAEIGIGVASVERDNQHRFDLLEQRFPIGFNRIDWSLVSTGMCSFLHPESPDGRVDLLLKFWRCAAEYAGIGPEQRVVLAGDSMETAVMVPGYLLDRILPEIILFPQHFYIFPADVSWCFSYTFEGDAYFGYADK